MTLPQRIILLSQLGKYLAENGTAWHEVKLRAERENGWFTPAFTDLATAHIANSYLQPGRLEAFTGRHSIAEKTARKKTVGLVMAGNIPLVGFHDFLCVFLSGHKVEIKPSSKDEVLIKHLIEKLIGWEPQLAESIGFRELLKGCDAYIATGSNNSARYFDYYFGKYPSIIRRNRTSVAVLEGNETREELERLADDVHLYFGLGCRNVTKIWVPEGYDFLPLLEAFKKYGYLAEHNKYKNNYDYQLALLMLNHRFYMTNGSLLLTEEQSVFSPVSQLNYSFYTSTREFLPGLQNNPNIQCITGRAFLPFGEAQQPQLDDFADGADTMAFLEKL
jgi:hypothetical protein